MKTTIDLPAELVREMKLRAVHEGRKLKDVAAELLKRGLSESETAKPTATKATVKFPLFPCDKNSPATRMTGEELLALEQETLFQEDLQRLGHPV